MNDQQGAPPTTEGSSGSSQQSPPQWQPPAPPSPEWERRRGYNRGGVGAGIILILLGVLFLAAEFVPGLDLSKLWPLILVAIGIGIILRRR